MFTILTQAFRRTIQNWPIVLLIFIVNFCLGLCLAFPAFNILQTESNQSLAFDNLITGFDFTIFSDFLTKGGKSLKSLLPIGFALTALYAILNVFFSGGILSQFTLRETFRVSDFLRNSAKYFFKFLLIFLIQIVFLIFAIIVSLVIYSIFGAIAYGKIEPIFMAWMIPPTVFMLFYITFLLNVGDYAKVLLHRDTLLNPWNAFWKASTYVFTNFKTMYIYWSVLMASVILLLFYLWLESATGMTSGFTIWLFFVVQQVFVFCRVFLRTWNLSNAFDFVSLRPIPLTPKPIIVAPAIVEESSETAETDDDTATATKLSD
jgi:hypothetical protein